jgi:hypothetical protein
MLDIWPDLPLVISDNAFLSLHAENITAALERSDRVCVIDLWGDPISLLSKSEAVIQNPFPALLDLDLRSKEWRPPLLPDSFLAVSAPRLRSIRLYSIPFPGIRNLLSSTSDLIHLDLWDISDWGYISPELMITSLSSLAQLKTLRLGIRVWSCPESRHPSPLAHIVLLNLTQFCFQGVSEYLERLVAHIDAPLLRSTRITFLNELPFDTSELPQFIDRSEKVRSLNTTRAELCIFHASVELTLSSQTETETADDIMLALRITFLSPWPPPLPRAFDLSLRAFGLSLPPLATSERLDIRMETHWSRLFQYDDPENMHWINLLRPFTAVKILCLFEAAALRVVSALEEVAVAEGSAHNMLPALQLTFLEGLQPTGPVQEAIGRFASARQLSGHPITVRRW